MLFKGRSVIGYTAQIVIGFLVGVTYWKWKGEDAEKQLKKQFIEQVIGTTAMVLGYLYARHRASE